MDRAERKALAVTGLIHGLVHSNILAIPVFLNLAWRSEFSADELTLGLLAAVAYATFGLGSVPFGYLSDRRGAPGLLALCTAGIAVSLLAVAASPDLPILAASLASLGLFSGIYHPAGLSYISRAVREQGRGMGWHGMGGSLGVALGPAAAGGLLLAGWGWRAVVGILVFPAVAAFFLLSASRLRESGGPAERGSFLGSLRGIMTRGFALVLLVYMYAGIAYWGSLTFLPRFVGAGSFAFLLGLGAIGQVVAGHLADRREPARTLLVLSLVAAGLLVAFASAPDVVPFAWLFGFFLFSLEPLQNTLVTAEVPRGARGLAFGMTFVSVFGVGAVGSVLAGLLLSSGQPALLFAILAGFLAASGVAAVASGRATRARRGR